MLDANGRQVIEDVFLQCFIFHAVYANDNSPKAQPQISDPAPVLVLLCDSGRCVLPGRNEMVRCARVKESWEVLVSREMERKPTRAPSTPRQAVCSTSTMTGRMGHGTYLLRREEP